MYDVGIYLNLKLVVECIEFVILFILEIMIIIFSFKNELIHNRCFVFVDIILLLYIILLGLAVECLNNINFIKIVRYPITVFIFLWDK
jgi:hypothetical protein